MGDKSAETPPSYGAIMPPSYSTIMPPQNHSYFPPGNQQCLPQVPTPQPPPPMYASQMQHVQSNDNPQYPGPPPQSPPYASQQPSMAKPTYPPTSSAAYPPTSAGYAPYPKQQYGYPVCMSQQNMTSNTTVVVAGDQIPVVQVTQEIPPNYAALSWFVCLCCCWPIGIAAIIASSRVGFALASGDINEARRQSERAKTFSVVGIRCGIAIIVFFVAFFASFYITRQATLNSH